MKETNYYTNHTNWYDIYFEWCCEWWLPNKAIRLFSKLIHEYYGVVSNAQ